MCTPGFPACRLIDSRTTASLSTPRITEEEYLRLERAAETKSELVDGEIVARPDGSLAHNVLAAKWIGPDMNAREGATAIESLEIAHEGLRQVSLTSVVSSAVSSVIGVAP